MFLVCIINVVVAVLDVTATVIQKVFSPLSEENILKQIAKAVNEFIESFLEFLYNTLEGGWPKIHRRIHWRHLDVHNSQQTTQQPTQHAEQHAAPQRPKRKRSNKTLIKAITAVGQWALSRYYTHHMHEEERKEPEGKGVYSLRHRNILDTDSSSSSSDDDEGRGHKRALAAQIVNSLANAPAAPTSQSQQPELSNIKSAPHDHPEGIKDVKTSHPSDNHPSDHLHHGPITQHQLPQHQQHLIPQQHQAQHPVQHPQEGQGAKWPQYLQNKILATKTKHS